jgi:hypothetical protein
MTYVSRMCARILAPSAVPVVVAMLVAAAAKALSDLPVATGGTPVWPDLPGDIMIGGAALSAGYYLMQSVRLLRWQRGHGDSCYVCGCLLSGERKGRWGYYRRCLGCSTTQSS